jgi:2,4-dienoyl-CoA reductase-like NADH-dependent reductase (Old Yellow Enzyme family)
MLEQPFTLPAGLRLSNRVVKAAMTERLSAFDGRPTAEIVRLYQRFASGGAGMLITGNVMVDARHLEGFGNAVLEDERHLPEFRRWSEAGASHGVPIVVQLNHPGRQAPRTLLQRPVAPSAVPLKRYGFFATPSPLTQVQIEDIIERFARSAVLAEKAGFAGVQVHAAHGYLLSQFLAPNVNQRDDAWGGSLENRARILLSIVERIRARVGARFALSVKLNAGDFVKGGFALEEAERVLSWLEPRGVDFVEISGGTFERPASFGRGLSDTTLARECYFVELARRARSVTSLPLMVTGGFRSARGMREALTSGASDLIGMARPLAVEPDLPRRLLADLDAQAAALTLQLPPGPIGALAELYWYRDQLEGWAAGRSAARGGRGELSLLWQVLRDGLRALAASWRRRTCLPSRRTPLLDGAQP